MSSKRKDSTDSIESMSNKSREERSYSIDSRSYSIDSTDVRENIINYDEKSNNKNDKFFEKTILPKRRIRESNSYTSRSPQLNDIIKLMENFKNIHENIYHK
jgi:hypothetical protein